MALFYVSFTTGHFCKNYYYFSLKFLAPVLATVIFYREDIIVTLITMKFGMEEYTIGLHLRARVGPDWGGCVGMRAAKFKTGQKSRFSAVLGFPSFSLCFFLSSDFPLLFPSFFFSFSSLPCPFPSSFSFAYLYLPQPFPSLSFTSSIPRSKQAENENGTSLSTAQLTSK